MVSKNNRNRFQFALASKDALIGEATTDSSGVVLIPGLKAEGLVMVIPSEDPGAALVLSDVLVGEGQFTVYTKNTGTDARAVLASKSLFYLLLKK